MPTPACEPACRDGPQCEPSRERAVHTATAICARPSKATIPSHGVQTRAAGYPQSMTDYSQSGAAPADDAAETDPPTVEEVLERQAEKFPEQSRTGMSHRPPTADEMAAIEAGGEPVDDPDELLIEGPNSA